MLLRIALLALLLCLSAASAEAVTIKNLTPYPVVGFIRHVESEHALIQFELAPGEKERVDKPVMSKGFVIQANYAVEKGRLTKPATAELDNLDCYITIEIFEKRLSIFVDDWPPGPVEVENPLKVDDRDYRKVYPLPEVEK